MPNKPFIGVRNSWLMLDKKSDFAWLAAFASSIAVLASKWDCLSDAMVLSMALRMGEKMNVASSNSNTNVPSQRNNSMLATLSTLRLACSSNWYTTSFSFARRLETWSSVNGDVGCIQLTCVRRDWACCMYCFTSVSKLPGEKYSCSTCLGNDVSCVSRVWFDMKVSRVLANICWVLAEESQNEGCAEMSAIRWESIRCCPAMLMTSASFRWEENNPVMEKNDNVTRHAIRVSATMYRKRIDIKRLRGKN